MEHLDSQYNDDIWTCLSISRIPPKLKRTFQERQLAGGRGDRAATVIQRWEDKAVKCLQDDYNDNNGDIRAFIRHFDSIFCHSAEVESNYPAEHLLVLLAKIYWLAFEGRVKEAYALVLHERELRLQRASSDDGDDDDGSVIVVEQRDFEHFKENSDIKPHHPPLHLLTNTPLDRSDSPLTELEDGEGYVETVAKCKNRKRRADDDFNPESKSKRRLTELSDHDPTERSKRNIRAGIKIENDDDLESALTSIKGGRHKPKASYSNWSCRPAPANIMGILRFDHPVGLSTQSEEKTSTQLVDLLPSNSKTKASTNVPPVRERKPARKPNIIPIDSNPRQFGISSTTFCAVLRLIAGLPRPFRCQPAPKTLAPKMRPPVWAESRQELCEALPYYRSFQSGLYMHDRVAYGYLLEAFPAPRDVWAQNGRVIISHGGGQSIRTTDENGHQGPPALQADQSSSDARVDALLLAAERKTPIILVAGAGYELLPWKLDCAYVVLGWYWISRTWVEGEPVARGVKPPTSRDYFHRYKIRFDWVQSQGIPWWERDDVARTIPLEVDMRSGENEWHLDEYSRSDAYSVPMSGPGLDSLHAHASGKLDGAPSLSGPLSPISLNGNPEQMGRRPTPESPLIQPGRNSRGANIEGLLTPPITPPTRATSAISPPPSSQRTTAARERRCPNSRSLACEPPIVTSENDDQSSSDDCTPCPECHRHTPQIYDEARICVNHLCKAFWMLPSPIGLIPIPPGFHLTLSPKFLECMNTPEGAQTAPYDVVPPPPVSGVPDEAGVGTRTLWKGWVCGKCGRANCRYRWEVWECRNCNNTLAPLDPQNIIPWSNFPSSDSFMGNPAIHRQSGVVATLHSLESLGVVAMSYDLPSAGRVWHVMSPHGELANDLLERYQREAAEGGWFQRRALKATAIKGQLLAQHFAVNSGASYKYNVDTISFSLEQSPTSIVLAHDVLKDTVRAVLKEQVPFNEVLSVMYREGQKMSWHDDGEAGLGPVVASLSLGSPATMSFRAKRARHDVNSIYYRGSGPSVKQASTHTNSAVALSLTLSHGDVLIMQGRDIQKRYEHRVVPSGFRIAATARVIDPDVHAR